MPRVGAEAGVAVAGTGVDPAPTRVASAIEIARAAPVGRSDDGDHRVNTVADAAEDAWNTFTDAAEDAWDAVAAAAEDAWEAVEEAASDAWDAVVDGAEAAWDRAAAIVEAGIDELSKAYEWAVEAAQDAIEWLGGLFVELAELFLQLGACLAGQVVYRVAKAGNVIANIYRPPALLSSDFKSDMGTVFSGAGFDTVFYVDDATLSANWFGDGTDGMTFAGVTIAGVSVSNVIYLDATWDETNDEDRKLMAHELVHVLQYRRFITESGFACAYGIGFAQAGFDYRANPMEDEAYDFVDLNSAAITS